MEYTKKVIEVFSMTFLLYRKNHFFLYNKNNIAQKNCITKNTSGIKATCKKEFWICIILVLLTKTKTP